MPFRSGLIAGSNRDTRRNPTEVRRYVAASCFACGVGGLRPGTGTYGLNRWPCACALARIRSTAAAITSEWSSTSDSVGAAGGGGGGAGGGEFVGGAGVFGGVLWTGGGKSPPPPRART